MILIAIALAALGGMGFMTMMLQQQRAGQKDVTAHLGIQALMNNVANTVENDSAWKRMVALNPNLSCLGSEGATCDPANFGAVDVVLSNDTVFAGKAATAGFDEFGNPCSQFNAAAGHKTCVYRLQVDWDCNGAACEVTKLDPATGVPVSPKIRINGTFSYAPDEVEKKARIKASEYNFSFLRSNRKDSVQAACRSLGAFYDQDTNKCKILKGSGTCPADYHMTGIDAEGNQICKLSPMINVSCPKRNAVVGVGMRGGLKCFLF